MNPARPSGPSRRDLGFRAESSGTTSGVTRRFGLAKSCCWTKTWSELASRPLLVREASLVEQKRRYSHRDRLICARRATGLPQIRSAALCTETEITPVRDPRWPGALSGSASTAGRGLPLESTSCAAPCPIGRSNCFRSAVGDDWISGVGQMLTLAKVRFRVAARMRWLPIQEPRR